MVSSWTNTVLGDIVTFVSGGTPSKQQRSYWDGSIPWVSAKDMKQPFIEDTEDHLTENGVANGTRQVPANTVLILIRGMTLLNDVPICFTRVPVTFNQDVKALCAKENVASEFLFYLLLGHKGTLLSRVDLAGHGTGRLNSPELRSLPVLLPPRSEQRAISATIGALDDKIELNRRMNHTLEQIARAIFQSWFVDFAPVWAKKVGRQPAGMDDETAALFPDDFEESELGSIPKGWAVGSFAEVVSLSRESVVPSQHPNEAFAHFSIPAFDAGERPAFELGREIASQKFVVKPGAVLVSKLNPSTPRVWLTPDVSEFDRPVCSTEFLVCTVTQPYMRDYFYLLASGSQTTESLREMATGTSGSHQRVRPEDFLSIKRVVPEDHVLDRFAHTVHAMLRQRELNLQQSRTLAAIRDSLLPKLISGEIRIKDAEKIVGEAV